MKAEWKDKDWSKSEYPEREHEYAMFKELTLPNGGVIARIEQFKNNTSCFYANTPIERSGCIKDFDIARQWCETKTGNKVN